MVSIFDVAFAIFDFGSDLRQPEIGNFGCRIARPAHVDKDIISLHIGVNNALRMEKREPDGRIGKKSKGNPRIPISGRQILFQVPAFVKLGDEISR